MAHKPRIEMVEATKKKLIQAARQYFGNVGYAETVMDELTAQAGMTRGALYHHFGDKKGLFFAVAQDIDAELDERLDALLSNSSTAWGGFKARCRGYLEMMIEPENQRVLLRDAPSVLGPEHLENSKRQCIQSMKAMLDALMTAGEIPLTSSDSLARLLSGGLMDATFWIANQENTHAALAEALDSLDILLDGLRIKT